MIISASLIRPFLLRCFGLLAEAFEREREVLFNSKWYSLQKSSAIQYISVTLLTSFMRIVILLYDWLSTVNIQKTILFLGFYWNFFEEKEELLIPNWGNKGVGWRNKAVSWQPYCFFKRNKDIFGYALLHLFFFSKNEKNFLWSFSAIRLWEGGLMCTD